ncbi:four helix bundle protein [Lacibacter cauensis]|uniref:Four helix bundle protein n=1 Tax=Lacibacter cauensis TaxID=510947 RepID=A0A562SVC2_9BACT|nr:four helix bundle protein [Lacibacter cauensis]TWI85259.1 four helix bundle protein [Lacibacter cauensis]
MATTTFQELIVWQKAHQFVLSVYKYTESFPKSETYGLSSQFRRAAVSIAANIAEGYKKKGKADKARFFNIAQGSLEECQYYLILSSDLGFGDVIDKQSLLNEISKMLEAYMSKILSTNS